MATLEQLMADMGLGTPGGQEKTASADEASDTTGSESEINDVLEGLGFGSDDDEASDAGVTKQASQEGNDMSLTDIYEEVFGDEGTEDFEKTAGEQGPEDGEDFGEDQDDELGAGHTGDEDASSLFGEAVGAYYSAGVESYLSKVAGNLEAEAGKGHQPLGYSQHVGQNQPTGTGQRLDVSGSETPYDMTANSPVLSRIATSRAQVGARRD